MRYLIKFTKGGEIKFISHLDLMRTIQRIIKRAELPIQYSQGFNPHMAISLAQPLSVGMYSDGEYMDVDFTENLDETFIKEKLNENTPMGIKFLEVVFVPEKENAKNPPQSMAAVEEAEYDIRIRFSTTRDLKQEIDNILNQSEWNILKKSKSGEKEINIKPLIKDFNFNILMDFLTIKTRIACGSRENLSAQLLAQYITEHTSNFEKEAFVDIKRKEMYAFKNGKLYPLYEFYKIK